MRDGGGGRLEAQGEAGRKAVFVLGRQRSLCWLLPAGFAVGRRGGRESPVSGS